MSILDLQKTADHITNWIKDYATNAGIKTLVLGLSGGVDSALVALLCKRTKMPVVCVNMPCHSSDSAFNRAAAFADSYELPLVKIDLSTAHDVVYDQAKKAEIPNFDPNRQLAVGGLRSCLRAPTLSFFANATGGLIVGTGNRSEDNLTRYFQKYGDGCVDISPIADLFKKEVYELFAFLSANTHKTGVIPKSAMDIYNAKPTADLWGPDSGQEDEKELGITYDDIEWADRENMRTQYVLAIGPALTGHTIPTKTLGIVENEADPAKHPAWLGYTGHQRIVIARMHALEKASRHKINASLPVCRVREVDGLVR